ncbi:hypothetical protein Q4E40_02760 [Pontibacter sp. BT731]|uniref:hypothetical protein n=1 Tax=Pontibacter coccineus TaxID=3063328 RepID=UPI0026E2170B|nr:hypothetical protein [Pontibacter sp. BT731]MDO6389034.1 hypothetical protein [Pontibacter sp. BT731]
MKPEQDDINWAHVQIAPLPIFKDNPEEQYWTQMLEDINQKLYNLEKVTLDAERKVDLSIQYRRELNKINQELRKIN